MKQHYFFLALISLAIAMLACIIEERYPPTVAPTLDMSDYIQTDIHATLFVYDASIGEDKPIAGAEHSLCDTPTSENGIAVCPWLTEPVTEEWWDEHAELGRRVQISVQVEGYQSITVVRYGWQTRSPEFKIGLLPSGISTPSMIYANLTASVNWDTPIVVWEGEQITIEALQGSWGAWGGPGGCYNRADGAGFADEYRTTIPVPEAPVGALIGRINDNTPFLIGNRLEMIVPQDGILSFGINDNALGDNCGELIVRILTDILEDEEGNLLPNGDFSQGLEYWTIHKNEACSACEMDVVVEDKDHAYILKWEQTGGVHYASAMRAYQRPDIDLRGCGSLKLSFDVRVDDYTLLNSGARFHADHGEYPAKITIRFLDSEGQRIEWTRGFLHEYDGTHLVNYTIVPPGGWYTYEVNLLVPENWVDHNGEPLPPPVILHEFNVSGSGYDYVGAITNLRLMGCQVASDGQ